MVWSSLHPSPTRTSMTHCWARSGNELSPDAVCVPVVSMPNGTPSFLMPLPWVTRLLTLLRSQGTAPKPCSRSMPNLRGRFRCLAGEVLIADTDPRARTAAVAASPSGPSMEPFPLVVPMQIGVQSLDEPRKGELVMRTRIPAASEGPGVP